MANEPAFKHNKKKIFTFTRNAEAKVTKTLWASGPCRKKGPTWRHGKNRTKNSMEQLTVSWTINYYSVDDIGRRFQALKQDDFSFSLKFVSNGLTRVKNGFSSVPSFFPKACWNPYDRATSLA